MGGGDVAYNQDYLPLHPLSINGVPMTALIGLALFAGIWRRWTMRCMMAILLTLATLKMFRMALFAAPLLVLVTVETAICRWPRLHASRMIHHPALWLLPALALLVLPFVTPAASEAAALPGVRHPRAAVDRLLACGTPAPVWNDYDFGGYLLARGEGRYHVGMDGRAGTLYPSSVIVAHVDVLVGRPGWQQAINDSPAAYALLRSIHPAAREGIPGWRIVHQDAVAVLAMRDGAAWRC